MTIVSTSRPCPVCDGTSADLLHSTRLVLPEGHPLPAAQDVVICRACGMAFADTAATAEDYERFYAEHSKYADPLISTGGGAAPGDRARLAETARDIAARLPSRAARIVDIGCANGGLLAALHGLGFTDLLGVDPSPDCVEQAGRLPGLRAVQGWLGRLPDVAVGADAVIVSHVLEHVWRPREAAAQLLDLLRPDGFVYAEVPGAGRYAECLAAPFQDFNVEHINHFGAASLRNLFAAAGGTLAGGGGRTIEAAPGVAYPAIFGFFQAATSLPEAWRQEADFGAAAVRYVSLSRALLARVEERLAPFAGRPVIVWGTGQLTFKLLAETSLGRAEIAAFTDGNPLYHGHRLAGVEILPPERLSSLPPHPIVIGTLLHYEAIAERIRGTLLMPNEIIFL